VLRRVAKFAVAVTVAAPSFSKAIDEQVVARWAQAGGVGYLIPAAWTEGEATERGITVSDENVREAMQSPHDGLTEADRLYESRVQLLNSELRAPIQQAAAQGVTQEQIDAYVQAHPRTSKGERRVRLLITRSPAKARAAERALRRGATWSRAAARYAPNGGPGLVTYPAPPNSRLERQIFKAPKNRLTRYGRYVFKVVEDTPPGPLPIKQQRATAWEILAGEAQQRATDEFEAAVAAKWRPRTMCGPAVTAKDFCSNSPTGQ
jgi:hypothetical protein